MAESAPPAPPETPAAAPAHASASAPIDEKLLPPRDGDAFLHELTVDQLSAFLLAAFTGPELLELIREAKIQLRGGYRAEALDDVGRADVLAGEIRDYPKARRPVIERLRKLYEFPALEAVVLPPLLSEELSLLAVEPDATIRILWRLMADPNREVRKLAARGFEGLANEVLGPAGPPQKKGAAPTTAAEAPLPEAAPPAPVAAPQNESAQLKALKKAADQADALVKRTQAKLATLKEQLKAARAEAAKAGRDAGQRGKAAAKLAKDVEALKEKLAEARRKTKRDELERLEKERDDLSSRVASLEERLKLAAEAREKLETARPAEAPPQRPVEPPKPVETDPALEAPPATWLFPRFTREFYDSLEKWDPRIQRAAFKQAFLLSENHRHPSLRAIPLEGLPGYYRVRIATDVRLIYRRSENEREVEILSLIDREDLDRYVRQAKTR